MSHVLVVFGTTDGHTAKVAAALGNQLRSAGVAVTVAEASGGAPAPEAFDAVIVAASVHAGGYQRAVKAWVRTHADALNRMRTAFVSVCLGILQHDAKVDRELDTILNAFFASTAWTPTLTKIVAGALKYTRYGIVKRWMMKRIVTKAGGDTDTSRDYEYTDWDDLRQFARTFAGAVQASEPARTA